MRSPTRSPACAAREPATTFLVGIGAGQEGQDVAEVRWERLEAALRAGRRQVAPREAGDEVVGGRTVAGTARFSPVHALVRQDADVLEQVGRGERIEGRLVAGTLVGPGTHTGHGARRRPRRACHPAGERGRSEELLISVFSFPRPGAPLVAFPATLVYCGPVAVL
ncbi:MAG: hypothetical protein ABR915_07965 [Thermoguttaceae bacterium]